MKIIFVRHGEPDYIKDCLTENGKKQAKNVAVRLKDQHIKAVFSSPMGRAKESAFYMLSMEQWLYQGWNYLMTWDI